MVGDKRPQFFLTQEQSIENFKDSHLIVINLFRNIYDVVASHHRRAMEKKDKWEMDRDKYYAIDSCNTFLSKAVTSLDARSSSVRNIYVTFEDVFSTITPLQLLNEMSLGMPKMDLENIRLEQARSVTLKRNRDDPELAKLINNSIDSNNLDIVKQELDFTLI